MSSAFETVVQAYINQGHELKIRKDGTTINVRIGDYIAAGQTLEQIGELMIEGAVHVAHHSRIDVDQGGAGDTRIDGGDS